MKQQGKKKAICPCCGEPYTGHPAVSRMDNETLICPDCGTREALEGLGIGKEEQNQIIASIHCCYHQ